MPHPNMPPTPGSSTDIRGKTQSSHNAPTLSLGPAAVPEVISERTSSSTPSAHGSDSSYHPHSPHSPTAPKRKHSTSQGKSGKAAEEFALPPPPSRSRKIIQMKPRTSSEEQQKQGDQQTVESSTGKGGRKKANNNGQTAAGRKIARKTAHSLIERRRRSKMNEEFGVLKDMIPACKGQEMHKLAILQASIDYLRYLERCITDLKTSSSAEAPAPPGRRPTEIGGDDDDEDEEMLESPALPPTGQSTPSAYDHSRNPSSSMHQHPNTLPAIHNLPSLSHITTASSSSTAAHSPSLFPIDTASRHRFSISSAASTNYSPFMAPGSNSAAASPLFTPSSGNLQGMNAEVQRFSLTSPSLKPQDNSARERSDREAMAALLMLNSDRRANSGWRDANGSVSGGETPREGQSQARGQVQQTSPRGDGRSGPMSVRDLLSH